MRTSIGIAMSALLASMLMLLGTGAAHALTEAKTAQGENYVAGGVALDEREALGKQRAQFSLWVATAAKKTGSYLSDVAIKISDAAGKTVLDTKLDGPWLLVELQPGRYTVDASFGNQSQRKLTTINKKGDHREMLFYFDLPVETLPAGAKD